MRRRDEVDNHLAHCAAAPSNAACQRSPPKSPGAGRLIRGARADIIAGMSHPDARAAAASRSSSRPARRRHPADSLTPDRAAAQLRDPIMPRPDTSQNEEAHPTKG